MDYLDQGSGEPNAGGGYGGGPTGIPDPKHPGYDTAGYPLPGGQSTSLTNTSPKGGTPWNVSAQGNEYGPDGKLIGATTPGAVSGSYTPPAPSGGGLVDPFTGPAPDYLHAPNFTPPTYQKPPAFSLPSGQDVLNEDPSFGLRLQTGEQALQNSAAAGGVLNTGNTLKDILGYGQNFASQEYGNAVGRRLQTYNTNYQSQYLDPYKFAYQGAMDSFMPKFADWSSQNNFDWGKYLQDYGAFRNRQRDTVDANAATS